MKWHKNNGGNSPFNEKVDPTYKIEIKKRLEKTHKHFPLKYKTEKTSDDWNI
jgi:hypothetical protein